MTLSFTITSPALPTFNAIIADAQLGVPVQLLGAGWTGEAWPRGLFAKVIDAASAKPASMKSELTPEMAASLSRAGISGSFVAFIAGAARGVIVGRLAHAGAPVNAGQSLQVASFVLPTFASPADYLLAAGLAAATARLAKTTVAVEDSAAVPSAPNAERAWTPEEVHTTWSNAQTADAHARQVSTWLADDIASGRTYFFQGPRGFVELGSGELASVPAAERFDRVRSLLMGADALRLSATKPADPRRTAVLLTAAMVFAAGADGVLADEEARQLEAHFATVKELVGHPARDLLDAVRADVRGIEALGELGTSSLQRKAFVLACEIIASARDGKLGGEPGDPNVGAVSALAEALGVDDDQLFLAQVVRTVMAKYEDSKGDDSLAEKLALGMVLTAAADGHIDEQEGAVLSALARTVPELKTRDVAKLFAAARSKMDQGREVALAELTALTEPRLRNKCFALATEVALISGRGPEGTMLPHLLAKIGPDRDYADAALATFAAKYC